MLEAENQSLSSPGAKQTVKDAKLESKVDVRQGDALEFKEFPEVTVVMLYMGDEFDALIRPHLWKNLKVGSRVVCHRFTFGDWKPDETKKVTGADGDEYEVHLWTITREIKDKAAKEAKNAKKAGTSHVFHGALGSPFLGVALFAFLRFLRPSSRP